MSSKRVRMIILGVILVVTLACVAEPRSDIPDDSPTRTPRAEGPTKVPASSLYYTTTAGSYTQTSWSTWQGSKHTYSCTGQDDNIEMVIWINTGEIYMNAYFSNFNEDCSLANRSVEDFDGSMHDDGSRTYVRWDTCAQNYGRASGTAVREGLINLLHLDDLTYDDVFIGGATCDHGDATDGYTNSFDFTLSYRGEYKP
jgi:hypothetical protein